MNHDGTLFVLGGMPFVGEDFEAPVHYLPPGDGAVWLEGPTLERMLDTPGAGVDGLGRLVVYGGYEPGSPMVNPGLDTFTYDIVQGPGDDLSRMPFGSAHAAFATDHLGRLYWIGGEDRLLQPTRGVARYDALADAWTVLADLPAARAHAAAAYDGSGGILVVGGGATGTSSAYASVFRYDIASGEWETTVELPDGRRDPGVALGANGWFYVVGGTRSYIHRTTTFIRNPVTGEWVTGPDLTVPRGRPTVVLSDEGYLFAIGGYTEQGAANTTEKLDTNPVPGTGMTIEVR